MRIVAPVFVANGKGMMKCYAYLNRAVLVTFFLLLAAPGISQQSDPVGQGELLIQPEGQLTPAPVRYLNALEPGKSISLILIPGGGLSSWHYTGTPDGREGWAQIFAAAGFPVYLMNPPRSTRDTPGRWTSRTVWTLWGFGPEYDRPFDNAQFPFDAIDELDSALLFERAEGGEEHLRALLDDIGPSIVLAHSAGGRTMFAVNDHANVRATIAIETLDCPIDELQLSNIYVEGERKFLSIWGDNLNRGRPNMESRYQSCVHAADLIAAAGGIAKTIRLPTDLQIYGNSHLLMQDRNSKQIADLIIDWIRDSRLD